MILRGVIDSNAGITLDDCERVSRAIDPILDEADPIENSYKVEVTSPGVERPLTRPDHFEACIGDEIEVKVNEIDAQGRINLIRNDIEYTARSEEPRRSEGFRGNRPPRRQ